MNNFKQLVSWILLILITLNACQSPLNITRISVRPHSVSTSDLPDLKLEPEALEQLAKQGFSDISFTAIAQESISKQPPPQSSKNFRLQQSNNEKSKGFWEEEHPPWAPWDQPHDLNAYTHSENTSDGKNHDVYYGYASNDDGLNPNYHTSWIPLPPALTHGFYSQKPSCLPQAEIYLNGVKLATYQPHFQKLSPQIDTLLLDQIQSGLSSDSRVYQEFENLKQSIAQTKQATYYTTPYRRLRVSWRSAPRYQIEEYGYYPVYIGNQTYKSEFRKKFNTHLSPFVIRTVVKPSKCQGVLPESLQSHSDEFQASMNLFSGGGDSSRALHQIKCPSEWLSRAQHLYREALYIYDRVKEFQSKTTVNPHVIYNHFGVLQFSQTLFWHPYFHELIRLPETISDRPFSVASEFPSPSPSFGGSPSPSPSSSPSASAGPSAEPSPSPRRRSKSDDDEEPFSPPVLHDELENSDSDPFEKQPIGTSSQSASADYGLIVQFLSAVTTIASLESYPGTQIFEPLIASKQAIQATKQAEKNRLEIQLATLDPEQIDLQIQLQDQIDSLQLDLQHLNDEIEELSGLKERVLNLSGQALDFYSQYLQDDHWFYGSSGPSSKTCALVPEYRLNQQTEPPHLSILYSSLSAHGDFLIHGQIDHVRSIDFDLKSIVPDFYGDIRLLAEPEIQIVSDEAMQGLQPLTRFSSGWHDDQFNTANFKSLYFIVKVPAGSYEYTSQYESKLERLLVASPEDEQEPWLQVRLGLVDNFLLQYTHRLNKNSFSEPYTPHESLTLEGCAGMASNDAELKRKKYAAWDLVTQFGRSMRPSWSQAQRKGICDAKNVSEVKTISGRYLQLVFKEAQVNATVQQALAEGQAQAEGALIYAIQEFLIPPDPRKDPLGFCIFLLAYASGYKGFQPGVQLFLSKVGQHTPGFDKMLAKLFDNITCDPKQGFVTKAFNPCSISKLWTQNRPGRNLPNGINSFENALGHWTKHKDEFVGKRVSGQTLVILTSKDYVKATHEFLKNPPMGALMFTRKLDGAKLIYTRVDGTFGVISKDGIPQTMFRPAPKGASSEWARNYPRWDQSQPFHQYYYFEQLLKNGSSR